MLRAHEGFATFPKSTTPQTLDDGDAVSLELLVNHESGVKIVDVVKVTFDRSSLREKYLEVAPKDFSLDAVSLTVKSYELMIDGLLVGKSKSKLGCEGSLLWIYIPDRGRFIFSLVPREGYAFQKIGMLDDNRIEFEINGEFYEWTSGDSILSTGGVWNLWVFRHEIVVRHSSPFFTSAILALTPPPAPLSLQNYTAFADVLALPLIPRLGIVVTFNLLSLFAVVLSAYAMFLYARARTGDPWAGWIGGAAFGFSSFMMIRQTAHFSLVLAAPLPIFGLLMHRMSRRPSYRLAIASGGVVAWAYFCDPYYAVYCLLILLYMVGYSAFTLDFLPREYRSNWPGTIVDLGLFTVGGLILAIAISGGRTFVLRGITVSATRLYTPMLVFSVLLILSVVGLVLNRIVSLVRRRVLFWDPSEKGVEIPESDVTARNPLAASRAAKESVA